MIRTAEKRGYVTDDQIHTLLASQEVNSEQLENILAKLSEMGINVVESKEARVEEEAAAGDEPQEEQETGGENELVEVQQLSRV
jgi:RNA polymerase primary sigma factor